STNLDGACLVPLDQFGDQQCGRGDVLPPLKPRGVELDCAERDAPERAPVLRRRSGDELPVDVVRLAQEAGVLGEVATVEVDAEEPSLARVPESERAEAETRG